MKALMNWGRIAGLLLFGLALCGRGMADTLTSNLTPKMCSEDGRLATKITIIAQEIRLGEFVERLAQASGIPIALDENEASSGRKILVVLDHMETGKAMDALWSLLSYQRAEWRWERSGKPGQYRYLFTQSLRSRQLPARLLQEAQDDFEAHVKLMMQVANMPVEERKQNAAKLGASTLKPGAEWFLSDDACKLAQAYSTVLSEEQQKNALRGRVRIPWDQLSEDSKTLMQANMQHYFGQNPTSPPPAWVEFYSHSQNALGQQVTPSLFIGTDKSGAISFAGGPLLQEGMQMQIAALWMLPGDATRDALGDRKVTRPLYPTEKETKSLPPPDSQDDLEAQVRAGLRTPVSNRPTALGRTLIQLGKGTPMPIMAILPPIATESPGDPYDQQAAQFIEKLHARPVSLMFKWRNGVLLSSDPAWYRSVDNGVSYALFRQLKRIQQKDGLLSLKEAVLLNSSLTHEQREDLKPDLPELTILDRASTLLELCATYPDAMRPFGVPVNAELMAFMRNRRGFDQVPLLFDGTAQSVRVIQLERTLVNLPVREFRLEALYADRKWHPVFGATQTGHSAPAK